MRICYRFTLDCARFGTLTGVFTAEENDIQSIIGENVYFGEVLGKHSEVSALMEPDMFTKLTDDQDFIAKFDEFGLESGYNPLDYYEED